MDGSIWVLQLSDRPARHVLDDRLKVPSRFSARGAVGGGFRVHGQASDRVHIKPAFDARPLFGRRRHGGERVLQSEYLPVLKETEHLSGRLDTLPDPRTDTEMVRDGHDSV